MKLFPATDVLVSCFGSLFFRREFIFQGMEMKNRKKIEDFFFGAFDDEDVDGM